jgi:hypothetical protein
MAHGFEKLQNKSRAEEETGEEEEEDGVGPNVPGIKAYLGQSKPNKLTSNGHSS